MQTPNELKYSKEHTWILVEGDTGTVGVTEFKTVSDLFMPVAGDVTAFNTDLKEKPTLVNEDPFAGGWMLKIKISNPDELNNLLSAEQYKEIVGS